MLCKNTRKSRICMLRGNRTGNVSSFCLLEGPSFSLQNRGFSPKSTDTLRWIHRFFSKGQLQLQDPAETALVAFFQPHHSKLPHNMHPKTAQLYTEQHAVSNMNYSQASSPNDTYQITPSEMERTKNLPSLETYSLRKVRVWWGCNHLVGPKFHTAETSLSCCNPPKPYQQNKLFTEMKLQQTRGLSYGNIKVWL